MIFQKNLVFLKILKHFTSFWKMFQYKKLLLFKKYRKTLKNCVFRTIYKGLKDVLYNFPNNPVKQLFSYHMFFRALQLFFFQSFIV